MKIKVLQEAYITFDSPWYMVDKDDDLCILKQNDIYADKLDCVTYAFAHQAIEKIKGSVSLDDFSLDLKMYKIIDKSDFYDLLKLKLIDFGFTDL